MNDYYTNKDDQGSGYITGNNLSGGQTGLDNSFYSDRSTGPYPDIEPEISAGTYYDNKPFSRDQFLKSPDYKDKRFFIRMAGGFILAVLIIDSIRLYIANIDFDIESAIWFIGVMFFVIATCEILIQMFMSRICAIVEVVCASLVVYRAMMLYLFFPPIGLVMLVVSAIHIEQAIVFEQKWKHYQRINSQN